EGDADRRLAWGAIRRRAGAAGRALHDYLGCREPAAADAGHGGGRLRPRPRLSGRVPVHARGLPVDVSRTPVDDAAVRRLWHGRGDEHAVPVPARPWPDGSLDGIRHADADGLRLGPRALAR